MRCQTIKREIAFDLITPHTIERTTVFPIWLTEFIILRLKELSVNMERNYDMLKLIVQKMEIETEADNHDEGFHTSHSLDDVINPTCSKWNSDVLRKNLIRQNAVISKWKEHSQHSNIQSTFDCWVRFWWSSDDILADESLTCISTLLSILIKNKSPCVSC